VRIVIILGIFEAAFLLLLLISKQVKRTSDFWLGVIFLLYILSMGGVWLEIHNMDAGFPRPMLINTAWLWLLLHGPALWFYIKSLTDQNFTLKPAYLFHLLPFFTFFTLHWFTFIGLPADEKIISAQNDLFKDAWYYKVSVIGIGISTISYNIWALLYLRRFRNRLEQQLSNLEGRDLSWLRRLTYAALTIYLINVGLFNLDLLFSFGSHRMMMLISYSFAAIYVFIIGFFGLRGGAVFTDPVPILENGRPKPQADESNLEITSILERVKALQPHLDPELTLNKLSQRLAMPPDKVSELLNQKLNQTLFDFVNKLRIEEFKRRRQNPEFDHLSILGLALECGFNSKAAFYRAYKKFEGGSPSAAKIKHSA
jgi:AraC-like DNA-binding protein